MILTAIAALLCVVANAQIRVDAPAVVGSDERFNITFSMTQKPDSFEWEPGENFQLIWGPQTGSSTSISIVNGKTTRSSSYTFTYILIPVASGVHTLPPAHAVFDGQDIYSKGQKIEVVGADGGSSAQQAQAAQASQSSAQSAQASRGASAAGTSGGSSAASSTAAQAQQTRQESAPAGSNYFMRMHVSRNSVVKGEPITATLKLYVRGNVSGFEDAKFPTFNGFWSQEVETPQSITFKRESVGDKIYETAVLRKWVLVPQTAGDLKIDPSELVCVVQQRVSSGNSIFDDFFDDYRTVRQRVITEPCTIHVAALPAGAPASFNGAVGTYKINASLSRDSISVNDATSLIVNIIGKGNVSLVSAPKIQFPLDSEVYDTKTSDKTDAGSGGTSGSKQFEYPFIPRSHGHFEIPPVEFTYFDVNKRAYVTLKTPALPYDVAQGKAGAYQGGAMSAIAPSQKGVRSLNEDIRYISTKMPELKTGNSLIASRGLYWFAYLLIAILAVAIYFIIKHFRAVNSDVVLVKTRGASKLARKRLSSAKTYLDKNLYSAFYEELHKALLGYASDKLNIQAAELSKESIKEAFLAAQTPESITTEYVSLIEHCEWARYAPDAGNEKMQEHYDKALELISSADANMKKGINVKMLSLVAAMLATGVTETSAVEVSVDSLWNSAVEAYASEQYEQAAVAFRAIEKQGYGAMDLFVNIANSYYKAGHIGPAILYYERALRLNPSDKDARYNLEIARTRTQDKIDSVPELVLKQWSRKVCYLLSSNAWAAVGLGLFILMAAMILLLLLSRSVALRRTGFYTALVSLLLCGICVLNANWQKRQLFATDSAIVYVSVCSVKTSPADSSPDQFILHEGTKVTVLEQMGQWSNISIADGREGWIQTKNIEVI